MCRSVAATRIRSAWNENPLETIVVVDDEEDILLLCRVNLEFEGYRVVTASSGVEGLRLARDLHPSMVLLDVMMPSMDGWHVLEALKTDPRPPRSPS